MRPASSFLDVASPLALEAARRITELARAPIVRMRKADKSLVTNADHEADKIIRLGLRKAFPKHAILTEESGLDGPHDAEYVWVVDPVDGTVAYAAGRSGYSVMVGLLRNEKPFAGVVVDPVEDDLYEAQSGQGAYHTAKGICQRVHVSPRADIERMPVITSTDFPPTLEEKLRHKLPGHWLPAVNSVGVKVGYLAREKADIYINHRKVHFWDLCAPQIILEEAGGTLTFWDGRGIDYPLQKGTYRHEGPTLATNGPRHRDILSILRPLV